MVDATPILSPRLSGPDLASASGMPDTRRSPAEIGRSFEAMFASMIVKQLRQTADGESIFPHDKGDVIGGMFDQFLGDHIARAGNLGIAQMIRTQLERRSADG